jgi:hypothetical protein
MAGWLRTIPDHYRQLPQFVEHGTVDSNPESKTTKRAEAAAPMRLEIIDLLDTRLGRKWLGTAPAHDRRGVVGTLRVHVERLVEERPLTATAWDDRSVADACNLLHRHRLWIAEQEWVTYLYADLADLNKALGDAVGDYKRPPVGKCYIVAEGAEKDCGGPLFASTTGGVHCARCRATWDESELRRLGMLLAESEQNERWLTADAIEKATGVKAGTIRVWAYRGKIPSRKHPTVGTVYPLSQVEEKAVS